MPFFDLILFIMYVLLLLTMIYHIFKITKNGWNIEAYFFSWFALLYIFIPILFILDKYIFFQAFSNSDFRIDSIKIFYSWMSYFIVIIFLSTYFFTKLLISKKEYIITFIKRRKLIFLNYEFTVIKLIGLFLSIISFSSLFVYAAQYGGFDKAIMYASLIRSGYGEEVQIGNYVFVKRFIGFSLLSFLIFIYLHVNKYKNNTILLCCIPLATLLFSKIFLFSNKEEILSLGLLIFLFASLKNKRSYFLQMFIFALLVITSLSSLDEFLTPVQSDSSSLNNSYSSLLKTMEYFTPQQISLEVAIQRSDYSFSFFYDLISNFKGTLLPTSWFSVDSYDTMKQNTTYFWGEYKSIALPGLLAFGYYSAGPIGIIIVGIISSILITKVDILFKSILNKDISFSIFYAYLIIMSGRAITTGMPRLFFYDHVVIVMLLTYIMSFTYEIKRRDINE